MYNSLGSVTRDQLRVRLAFGCEVSSSVTVFKGFHEFKHEHFTLEDAERPGRSSTAVTPKNVATVKKTIKEDPRSTFSMIEKKLKIGSAAVRKALHGQLH